MFKFLKEYAISLIHVIKMAYSELMHLPNFALIDCKSMKFEQEQTNNITRVYMKWISQKSEVDSSVLSVLPNMCIMHTLLSKTSLYAIVFSLGFSFELYTGFGERI